MKEITRRKNKQILHIYNRGNRKELICHGKKDYIFLYNLINFHFIQNHFDLICFCIMPNHYHILAIQKGNVRIDKVMQKIGARYTKYFNSKYSLSGHLFQGNYKSKVVSNFIQFKIVSIYIMENPKKVGLRNEFPVLFFNPTLLDYYSLHFSEE